MHLSQVGNNTSRAAYGSQLMVRAKLARVRAPCFLGPRCSRNAGPKEGPRGFCDCNVCARSCPCSAGASVLGKTPERIHGMSCAACGPGSVDTVHCSYPLKFARQGLSAEYAPEATNRHGQLAECKGAAEEDAPGGGGGGGEKFNQ